MDRPILPKRGSFNSHTSEGSAFEYSGAPQSSVSPYKTKVNYRQQYSPYDGSSPYSRSSDGGIYNYNGAPQPSQSPYRPPMTYGQQFPGSTQPYYTRSARQQALRFDSHSLLYGGDWGNGNVVALTTFNEEPTNYIHVVQANLQNSYTFMSVADALVTMPQTKVAWEPSTSVSSRLITSGDTLRLWQLMDQSKTLQPLAALTKLSKSQSTESPAPLTSFDWNVINPNVVITSSIDTTCTVWDLTKQVVSTQLIAHDQEVYDVEFLYNSQCQFVSAGADGSARLFDLRSLDNSTIIFEPQPATPLLRVAPSPHDANILCVIAQDRNVVYTIDIRASRNPLRVLEGHESPVNSIRWLPQAPNIIASGGDDCQILLWDVSTGSVVGSLSESTQINNVVASPDGKWLGSIFGKSLQGFSTQMV